MKNLSNSPKTVGNALSEIRIKKGLSIDAVSEELKIRKKYLIAIEADDYGQFRSDVYLLGFIKNYSKFLGVNPELMKKLYLRANEREQPRKVFNVNEERGEYVKNNKINKNTIIILLFVVLFFSLYFLFNIFIKTRKPTIIIKEPFQVESASNNEFVYDTKQEKINISGSVETGNSIFLNNNKIETYGLNDFSTNDVDLQVGQNILELKSKNQFGVEGLLVLKINRGEVEQTEQPKTPEQTESPTPQPK